MSKKDVSETKERKGKLSKYWRLVIVLLAVTAVLNLLGCFRAFCDWYKLTIYGLISDALGLLMGWIPVPVGELLGLAGIVAVLLFVVLLALLIFLRKKAGFRRFVGNYAKGLLLTVVLILFIYTLNWILPFRATILKVKGATEREYSILEVQNVRNHLAEMLNACAEEVPRDESGRVIYDKKAQTKAVFEAMKAQAGEYPILSGYYPPIKDALCSDLLEWMNIGGYTYPYTMEITWNRYCDELYYPTLLAHEASHHQGYYQENEANFIAFLACTHSEDPVVRYSGYQDFYEYVNGAYVSTLFATLGREAAIAQYREQVQISEQVSTDIEQAIAASQELYESVSHPAESLSDEATKVADVGWQVQGDLLQENSYHGVVKMILEYYDVLMKGDLTHGF